MGWLGIIFWAIILLLVWEWKLKSLFHQTRILMVIVLKKKGKELKGWFKTVVKEFKDSIK